MKKLVILIVLFTLCVTPYLRASEDWIFGKESEHKIFTSFQKNEYADFLAQLDLLYKKACQNEELSHLFILPDEIKRLSEEETVKELSQNYLEEVTQFSDKINQQLLQIAKSHPELLVSKIIKDYLVTHRLTQADNKDLEFVAELLFTPSKKNALLESLNEITIECIRKHSLLYMAKEGLFTEFDFLKNGDINEYAYALRLSSLQKMLEVAKQDSELSRKITQALKVYRKKTASQHDWSYLKTLGNGKRLPSNIAEEKVALIVKSYQDKQRALIQQFFFK